MSLPSLTSTRGQISKYFSQKTTFGDTAVADRPSNNFNDPQNGNTADSSATPDGKEAVTEATITALDAATQKTTTDEVTGEKLYLSYNPITDQFKVNEGSYVL